MEKFKILDISLSIKSRFFFAFSSICERGKFYVHTHTRTAHTFLQHTRKCLSRDHVHIDGFDVFEMYKHVSRVVCVTSSEEITRITLLPTTGNERFSKLFI